MEVFPRKRRRTEKKEGGEKKDKRATTKNVVHDDVFANVFNRVVDVKGRHPRFHALLAQLTSRRQPAAASLAWSFLREGNHAAAAGQFSRSAGQEVSS